MAGQEAAGRAAGDNPVSGMGIDLARNGALGLATLCRRDRRNALSQAMVAGLTDWFPPLARDAGVYAVAIRSTLEGTFSVGGDVRAIIELASTDIGAARRALGAEYALCWLQECFSKPTVSLIDGIVMGTGVGISLYGTHRIAGEGYRLSMPETAIGCVPDCGVVHAFARMPSAIGLYLGLLGVDVGPADALALGLATHHVPRAEHEAILAHLADADPVDPVLDSRHRVPVRGTIMADAARIERYFNAPYLVDVIGRLEKPVSGDEAWAASALARLRERSPLACCLTFRAITAATQLDIRETLQQDFRLAWRLAQEPDFLNGVRAVLIEKRGRPDWRHARIEDVPASLVEDYFAPLGPDELALPSRADMQAARV